MDRSAKLLLDIKRMLWGIGLLFFHLLFRLWSVSSRTDLPVLAAWLFLLAGIYYLVGGYCGLNVPRSAAAQAYAASEEEC